MKLYHYDHCPYCVKARMIFGLKKVPFETEALLNDDEATPIAMVGQKMLPILQKDDGDCMPESLDIITYIDELGEYGAAMVQPSKNDERLIQWLQEVRSYHYALAMPRWPRMGLPEFASTSAQKYFTVKKEKSIGPFSENLAKTKELIQAAHDHLPVLEKLIVGEPYFWGEELSLDDFHVFASLRCLTTTRGVRFPKKINDYMNRMSNLSQVPLHWDQALGEDLDG